MRSLASATYAFSPAFPHLQGFVRKLKGQFLREVSTSVGFTKADMPSLVGWIPTTTFAGMALAPLTFLLIIIGARQAHAAKLAQVLSEDAAVLVQADMLSQPRSEISFPV